MAEIVAGSVVRMKHEDVYDSSMTVESITADMGGNLVANVVWFDVDNHLCRAGVPLVALKLWPETTPAAGA